MENTPISDDVVASKKNVLFEVTTLSKVLAAVLFIVLPFVGFWLGMQYGGASEAIGMNNSIELASSDVVGMTDPETAQQQSDTKIFQHYQFSENDYNTVGWTSILGNESKFIQALEISNDISTEIGGSSEGGHFMSLVTAPTYTIFARAHSELGMPHGLFKYDVHTKEMHEMATSEYYHFQHLSTFSPDKTKLLTVNLNATVLGYVDISTDTFVPLRSYKQSDTERFLGGCEISCVGNLEWIDTTHVRAQVFEFETCGETSCEPYYAEKSSEVVIDIQNPEAQLR